MTSMPQGDYDRESERKDPEQFHSAVVDGIRYFLGMDSQSKELKKSSARTNKSEENEPFHFVRSVTRSLLQLDADESTNPRHLRHRRRYRRESSSESSSDSSGKKEKKKKKNRRTSKRDFSSSDSSSDSSDSSSSDSSSDSSTSSSNSTDSEDGMPHWIDTIREAR